MSSVKTGKSIVSIDQKKKNVLVTFDDGSKLEMGLHSFTDQPLYVGKEVSNDEFKKLKTAAKEDSFYDYALRNCLTSSHTVHEIASKLEDKGANQETISSILSRLCKLGLLDDKMYASVYASDIADLKLYGRRKVLFELKKKGVKQEIIDSLEYDENAEMKRAIRLATMLNKRNEKTPNLKKKRKMIVGMMERGFYEDIAKEAVEQAATINDATDERVALKRDYYKYRAKYEHKISGRELYQKVFVAMMKKGYSADDIKTIAEENEYDD